MEKQQTAYFRNIGSKIINILNEARNSVSIAMAWFTNKDLFDALQSCLKRGVKVSLVLLDDVINWQNYAPDFNDFISSGGVLYVADMRYGFMHHKFCIVDGAMVITGSYNWTYYAEIRNLENIVITTDKNVVAQYENEFSRLSAAISPASECKRLDFDALSRMSDIDYNMLNTEVECIAKERDIAFKRIVQSNMVVKIVEERFRPVSACNIGIVKCSDDADLLFDVFIRKGVELPFTETRTFNNYKEDRNDVYCTVAYGNSKKVIENRLLIDHSLTELTNGRQDFCLKFQIQMTLNTNGYLHVEAKCVETGRALDLTETDTNLVEYEK